MKKLWGLFLKEKFPQRILVYIIGLYFAALGVVFAVNSALGVSPFNSFPYILSRVTGMTMGVCSTIVLVFCIVLQVVILRRKFKLINITQILFSFFFGFFVDFNRFLLGSAQIPSYFGQLLMLAISIFLIALGVTLYLLANLIPLPPEGVVLAIVQVRPQNPFHRVKIIMDSSVVAMGILFSILALGGLYGIREGTIISAVFIGKAMPPVRKFVEPKLRRLRLLPS